MKVATADAVVIGGGIIGLMSAWALRERGLGRVVVLDKDTIGGVASPRAAGMLRRLYHIPLLVDLATAGEVFYARFAQSYGHDIGYERRGYLMVQGAEHRETAVAHAAMQRARGVDVDVLDSAEVEREVPEFRGFGDAVTTFERSCSSVDPRKTVRAVAAVLQDRGVELVPYSRVEAVEIEDDHVAGIVAGGRRWSTPHVVNASGAWGREVRSLTDGVLPLQVRRLLHVAVIEMKGRMDAFRVLSHEPLDFYARPWGARHVLVGGRITIEEPNAIEGTQLVVGPARTLALRDAFAKVTTAMLGDVVDSWVGIDGHTPDFQPIVGRADGVAGWIDAVGFSGHGFKLAPAVGGMVASLVTNTPMVIDGAEALTGDRFGLGRSFVLGTKQMGA